MKQNKSIAWNIFVNVFITLLIAIFIFSIYIVVYDIVPGKFAVFSTESLFFVSLILLFSIFLVLLISLISLWFCSNWKDCVLIVPKEIRSKSRNNIISAMTGFTVLIVILFFIMGVMATEKFDILQPEQFIRNSVVAFCGILYSIIVAGLLYNSFEFRSIVRKIPSNDAGERVKKRVYLLPYLFVTFLLFEHVYFFGLIFFKNICGLVELVGIFQLLVIIWIFCAWKINDLFYTQEEYDNMLWDDLGTKTGFGAGLGAYPNSFCKLWICSGFIYWGIPVFIYFLVVIIIISLFLPLTKIIEKLG